MVIEKRNLDECKKEWNLRNAAILFNLLVNLTPMFFEEEKKTVKTYSVFYENDKNKKNIMNTVIINI